MPRRRISREELAITHIWHAWSFSVVSNDDDDDDGRVGTTQHIYIEILKANQKNGA